MSNLKYKVGDSVRIKSINWYNENKNKYGNINCGYLLFTSEMSIYCGAVLTICDIKEEFSYYDMKKCEYMFTDEMIEGLVEEETKPNIIEEAKTYWDSIKDAWICPQGYQFVDENGNIINAQKIILEKKKNRYPKTYKECCEVLDWNHRDYDRVGYEAELLCKFQVLLLCRDAYWKIAGEEMKLGKPWEPDWKDNYQKKWTINFYHYEINLTNGPNVHFVLAFPTEEMRDAFYNNFKELIEICKELL